MAEDMIDIPATPEPEKIAVEDDHTRRNSTGNLSIPKNEVKVLPRYLSAKVDSCHDYCKYGIKHILEKKARIPIRKRITAKLGQGECQYQVEVVILEAKKKISLISTKPLADSKGQTTDKHEVIEKEAPVPAKKIAASSKPFFSPGAPGDRINVSAKYASDLRPKPVQTTPSSFSTPGRLSTRRYSDILPVQIKPSFSTPGRLSSRRYSEILPQKGTGGLQASPVGGSSSRRHSDTGISKEIRTSKLRKKNNSLPPTISPSPRPSINRELTARSGHYKEPKQVSHLRSQRSVRKAKPKQPIDEKVPEKTLYVIETKPVNPIVGVTKNGNGTTHSSWSPSQSSKVKKLEHRRHRMQTSQSPPSTESKKLRHKRNGIHITQSSSSSSLSSENKRLRRTKNGNRNAPSCSSSLSLLSSSSSVTECMKSDKSDPIPEGSGSKTENQIANHSSRPRRVVRVISEGKVRSPQKLNFTRGKVVDVQPKNISPRILRFKQRRVLGENQSGKADVKQRSFKKVVATADLNGSETKPTNVVLRHQAVEGKKGAQSLLNNVIEETASKLVETRKSKVKALVGAFETVISLQDTKSSATTSAS